LRIVSLLASATEIVCALGAGGMLVGRSHECDNPEWVRALPACSEPAFDVTVPSGAIDAEVQRHVTANIEKAKELGAEVVRLKGDDPARTLLDFARTHAVERIIVGRSREPWWRQMLFGSVLMRLLREGAEFDLHVAAATGEERA